MQKFYQMSLPIHAETSKKSSKGCTSQILADFQETSAEIIKDLKITMERNVRWTYLAVSHLNLDSGVLDLQPIFKY